MSNFLKFPVKNIDFSTPEWLLKEKFFEDVYEN